jgi:hypothetical protein
MKAVMVAIALAIALSGCSMIRSNGEEVAWRDLPAGEKAVHIGWWIVGAVVVHLLYESLTKGDGVICTTCPGSGEPAPRTDCYNPRNPELRWC